MRMNAVPENTTLHWARDVQPQRVTIWQPGEFLQTGSEQFRSVKNAQWQFVMIFPAGVWYQCQGIRGEQPCVSVWTQRCNSLSTVVEDVLQSKALESVEKNTYQMDVENQDIILERIFELIDLYS